MGGDCVGDSRNNYHPFRRKPAAGVSLWLLRSSPRFELDLNLHGFRGEVRFCVSLAVAARAASAGRQPVRRPALRWWQSPPGAANLALCGVGEVLGAVWSEAEHGHRRCGLGRHACQFGRVGGRACWAALCLKPSSQTETRSPAGISAGGE
jgi:hypothetical protein